MNLYKATNRQKSFHILGEDLKDAAKKATDKSNYKVYKLELIEENI